MRRAGGVKGSVHINCKTCAEYKKERDYAGLEVSENFLEVSCEDVEGRTK